MSPLIRLLRIVDSDEKPAMGYVYDGMYRVTDGLKKNISRIRKDYGSLMLILSRIVRIINSIEIFMLLLTG